MAAIAEANAGMAVAYGNDPWTARLEAAFNTLFETETAVFPVATGTAANVVALSSVCPQFGSIYCHRHAHIEEDECGAPEFYTGGGKLHLLEGENARFDAETLAQALAVSGRGVEHHIQPAAVSITQATEAGTLYQPHDIKAIAEVAERYSLPLHMDGARFANAVATLGISPAEASWKSGVDILSFGATKNGALAAEAVVFFKPELAEYTKFHRKRGGHLFSKMRFLSAQLLGYLENGHWLENARHANACAKALSDGLAALPGVARAFPTEANEVFVSMPQAAITQLLDEGFVFHRWGGPDSDTIRLVTAYNTDMKDVSYFLERAAKNH